MAARELTGARRRSRPFRRGSPVESMSSASTWNTRRGSRGCGAKRAGTIGPAALSGQLRAAASPPPRRASSLRPQTNAAARATRPEMKTRRTPAPGGGRTSSGDVRREPWPSSVEPARVVGRGQATRARRRGDDDHLTGSGGDDLRQDAERPAEETPCEAAHETHVSGYCTRRARRDGPCAGGPPVDCKRFLYRGFGSPPTPGSVENTTGRSCTSSTSRANRAKSR